MRLYYLRGFENLMYDIATDEPNLHRLVRIVADYWKTVCDQWLAIGVDVMGFAEDLGTQDRSVISPRDFAKWITPVYRELMQPFRKAGTLVALHSDGHIMELMGEFIAAGVDIINPQDLCNGIDELAREVKGRMCIRLDVDRQSVVPFGTPREIRGLIEEEVRKLGSPEGGLELICGIYPPTPAENLDAVCSAMEEFRTWWWDGRGG
jgi:uroporphyrinogen decarboxylase